jgi:hypothetical protein
MRAKIGLIWAGCMLVLDCTATETGNPVAEQHVALTARTSQDDITVGSPGATPHTRVKQAWIVLGDIRFVAASSCAIEPDKVDIAGPVTVELVWKPKSIDFAVEDVDYCRVVFPLRRAKAPLGEAPPELEGYSIYVSGERADKTPFQLRSRLTSEADIRAPAGKSFRIKSATSALIIGFDLGMWLRDIDLDSLQTPMDGTILIDDAHEQDSLAIFEQHVDKAMALFRDQNHDGALDATDTKTPLASGK